MLNSTITTKHCDYLFHGWAIIILYLKDLFKSESNLEETHE